MPKELDTPLIVSFAAGLPHACNLASPGWEKEKGHRSDPGSFYSWEEEWRLKRSYAQNAIEVFVEIVVLLHPMFQQLGQVGEVV